MSFLPDFKLETYFSKWEFNTKFNLCASDTESLDLKYLLSICSKDEKKLWDDMRLGYTETFGSDILIDSISKTYDKVDKKDILTFAGAEEGIYISMNSILSSDDHCIVITPNYQSAQTIPSSICDVTNVDLDSKNNWNLDLGILKDSIKPNTKLISINFPHNPTGKIISQDELNQLVDICRECGVPPGVVNLLSGDPPSIAQQLISSDIIKKISITGSTRVGKLILKQAADKVQRVTMELSGHSPFIVFEDADIKKAADMAISAKFRNNGQVCISPNRFYIHEKKKKEFVNLFVEKTKKLKIGNGMDPDVQLGPLTTKKRLNELEDLVETTKKEGAKVLLGGKRPSDFNKGFYYEPTIFDDVKDDFTIMRVEPFGPLVPMLSFNSFDEVVKRANNNDLGLCSYICTNSMEKAHKASEMMETGTVAVNTPVVAIAEAPFGGIKQTGYGREGGSMAIKDYLNVKYTHLGLKG